jgi:transposase-like protein
VDPKNWTVFDQRHKVQKGDPQMQKHRTFQPEFKARIVLQVLTGAKTAAQVYREQQLSERLLTSWEKQLIAYDGQS